jgi:hypothetical protein
VSEKSNNRLAIPCILNPMLTCKLTLLLSLLIAVPAAAQSTSAALDGPNRQFLDDFVNHLAGVWNITGQILGKPVSHRVTADWTLNHQFLHIHEKDTADPSAYEVDAYIGYDNLSERYVAHWLDVFGGRLSETLGFGKRDGNSIRFLFEYPDGPFVTWFVWKQEQRKWQFVLESKNSDGKWTNFATLDLSPAGK